MCKSACGYAGESACVSLCQSACGYAGVDLVSKGTSWSGPLLLEVIPVMIEKRGSIFVLIYLGRIFLVVVG